VLIPILRREGKGVVQRMIRGCVGGVNRWGTDGRKEGSKRRVHGWGKVFRNLHTKRKGKVEGTHRRQNMGGSPVKKMVFRQGGLGLGRERRC